MKDIFHKDAFSSAPGGNIYHWQDVDTAFEVPKNGYYVIAITASANSATQNKSTDDDDLRAIVDDYEFGKHEAHQAKVSWRGFGTAASWNGASLKGGTKTVYFFVALEKGEHTVQFWADGKPIIHKITVSQIKEKAGAIEDVVFEFDEKASGAPTDTKGIPWKAFVFTGDFNTINPAINLIEIQAQCQSAKQKGGTDGDNVRLYVNGQIVHNPKAPTSDKYKNFFFSGDLSQGTPEISMIDRQELMWSDQDISVELWYDETPTLGRVKVELIGNPNYDRTNRYSWLTRLQEFAGLPFDLQVHFWDIRRIVSESRDTALQYAEENGFTAFNDDGSLVRLIQDNEPDALRHFTWNVLLTRKFDGSAANIITTNHEIFWMDVTNKHNLSRAGVQDIWNNKQGREYAVRFPDKEPLELFELSKSEGNLILNLDDVTDEHREKVAKIISDMKDGT